MSEREITVLTDVSLITCVVQRGLADDVIKAAQEAGAQGATTYFAHGSGVRERLGILGVAVEVEKEVINIVVANDQVERVFEKMYLAGQLDTPAMGIIYTTPLEKLATHIPDAILEKLSAENA
ncbi:MAG: P-II family nitrogen regulator [Gammaproteobacteria bacterium]|nr:P-II family nitrogen regulator [Gammaproteobacteria bacterium]